MAKTDRFCNRAEAFEAYDDVPLSPPDREAIGDVILKRYSRRERMQGTLGVAAAAALFGPALLAGRKAEAVGAPDRFDFAEVEAGVDQTHHVAEGYRANILLRWGDPLFADSPPFDPLSPRRSSSSSATTTTTSLSSRSTTAASAGCSASITKLPTKKSCSRTWFGRIRFAFPT
jgi:hypothetical protein